jgi:transcriptional antiterminator RfaH
VFDKLSTGEASRLQVRQLCPALESENVVIMSSPVEDSLSWYVVHTHPKQEDRANMNLRVWGVETLNPKLRVNKYNQFTGEVGRIVKPLFPGYLFVRFSFSRAYNRIRFTRGVHSVICFNNAPTPVDEAIVELVRARIDSDGFVKTLEELKAGDEVRINEGRFQNLCGVFERQMPNADRVRILLHAVSFQAHVVVDRALVSKVQQEERSPLSKCS